MKIINADEMAKISESNLEKIVKEQNEKIEATVLQIIGDCMKAANVNKYEATVEFPYSGVIKETVLKILNSLGYKCHCFEEGGTPGYPRYSFMTVSWQKGGKRK